MAHASSGEQVPRRYHSPVREQGARHTRERVIGAATARFLTLGYAATTMRAVARDAEVSLPTVELIFGTKPHLLRAAINVAIRGDDQPVPVLERDWATTAEAAESVRAFLEMVATVLADTAQRAAGLVVAALEAANVDMTLGELAEQLRRQRAHTATWIVDGVMQRSPIRADVDRGRAVDIVWVLMDPNVFCALTRHRGWSPKQFETWFVDSVERLLLPKSGRS